MIHHYVGTVGETEHEVSIERLDGEAFRVTIGGRVRVVEARQVEAGTWSLLPRDESGAASGAGRIVDVDGVGEDRVVTVAGSSGHPIALKLTEGRRAALAGVTTARHKSGPTPLRSPMPGKVVKVLVKEGEAVKAGQGVVVVEAMKMENELKAPRDGTVAKVHVVDGATVESGQTLVTIE